jgi:D-aminopeptidase
VYDAACQLLMGGQSTFGEVIIPVVGECDDSWLSDPRAMHVTFDDVRTALEAARAGGEFAQGAVGAGTGMSCLGWKGGIGSASRVLPDGHVVGVLLLTNYGTSDRLTIDGVDVGKRLARGGIIEPPPAGSCIGIAITDAPIDASGCERLARRIGLGLARTGSVAHHGSGEIFLAMANGLRSSGCGGPPITGRALDGYFAAVVDASEEAVIASLINAETTVGYQGREIRALPIDEVKGMLG